jgi:GNAT superfamily N-acetyltransferase
VPAATHLYANAPITSLNAFLRQLQYSAKVTATDIGGLYRWQTAIPHPWFNGVLASRAPSGNESATIQEQVAYFRLQGKENFTWWLEPEQSIEDWASQLQPHGFKINQDVPGMVCDLKELPAAIPTPPGFTIQVVNDLVTFKVWVEVFCPGYGLPESFIKPLHELFGSLGLQDNLRHYLGYLDKKPVAAASIFYSEDTAGIYNVAVLEQARGQGLGAAITLAPLLEARAQGYALGALQSSDMGFKVYQRLGFIKVCDVTHFYYEIKV